MSAVSQADDLGHAAAIRRLYCHIVDCDLCHSRVRPNVFVGSRLEVLVGVFGRLEHHNMVFLGYVSRRVLAACCLGPWTFPVSHQEVLVGVFGCLEHHKVVFSGYVSRRDVVGCPSAVSQPPDSRRSPGTVRLLPFALCTSEKLTGTSISTSKDSKTHFDRTYLYCRNYELKGAFRPFQTSRHHLAAVAKARVK